MKSIESRKTMATYTSNNKIGKSNIAAIWSQIKRNRFLYALFFLPFCYFIIFKYLPMYGLIIGFKDYDIVKGINASPWVGLKYFKQYLADPYFWKLVRNTLLLGIYSILWSFPMPIILALLINELGNKYYKQFIQSVSYLPHFISTVVVCGMLVNFLSSDGMINQMLASFSIHPIQFLMLPQWFRTIYISSDVWQTAGWNSIIYLATLTGINDELYEAATMDGAGRFKKMLYVTLPGMATTISVMMILDLGHIISLGYQKIILLYNGSTYETADILSTYIYRRGLQNADFSYGTAIGLFEGIVSLVLVVGANKVSKKISDTSIW
jgi:putative aldouronate transport system permease protein